MSNEVTIVEAPGYADHFKAQVIPGLESVPARDNRGELAVITWGDGEIGVVPARCVIRGVDLVKRYEVDYDWHLNQWGVRHAYDGPFVHYGRNESACRAWIRSKVSGRTL